MQEARQIKIPTGKVKEMDLFLKYIAKEFPELYYIYFTADTDRYYIDYKKTKKIRHFDAFAWAGGFSIALQEAKGKENIKTVWFSEIDKFAIKTYEKNFPGVQNFWDISQIDINALPDFDLLTWGFPCQDVSVAGKQDLTKGRTILVEYLLRILEVKQPEYFIFENVKGLMSKKFDDFRDDIFKKIHWAGYKFTYKTLNAKDFGTPQNRERVFIIGTKSGTLAFPEPIKSTKVIKDILEESIDLKYLLSWKTYERLKKHESNSKLYCIDKIKPKIIANTNPSKKGLGGNVYDSENISPTITTNKGEGIKILEKYTYSEKAAAYMQKSNTYTKWKTRIEHYGNHENEVCRTVTANFKRWAPYNNVIIQLPRGKNKDGIHESNAPTLTKNLYVYNNPVSEKGILRKLTPIECERLQGFPDNWTAGISDSQRYKQMGNAVNVKNAKAVIIALI